MNERNEASLWKRDRRAIRATASAPFNLRDFAEDEVLRKKAEMYLDLTHAVLAEETLLTTRGGPKSRVKVGHEYDGGFCERGYDLLFNAPGRTYVPLGVGSYSTSSYYPPPAVVNLAKDTTKRGAYVFATRCRGRSPPEGEIWKTPTEFSGERWIRSEVCCATASPHQAT